MVHYRAHQIVPNKMENHVDYSTAPRPCQVAKRLWETKSFSIFSTHFPFMCRLLALQILPTKILSWTFYQSPPYLLFFFIYIRIVAKPVRPPATSEIVCFVSCCQGLSMESLEVANGKSSALGVSREASSPPQMGFFIAQVVLRFFTLAFTGAAIAVMVTAKETVEVFSISFTVRYSYLSAFK